MVQQIHSYGNPNLYLVDPPIREAGSLPPAAKATFEALMGPQMSTTLRVGYSENIGGILLPEIFGKFRTIGHTGYDDGAFRVKETDELQYEPLESEYRLLDTLSMFLQHEWHLSIMFSKTYAINPHWFLYLLSHSIWRTNLTYLRKCIEHISFREIRNPSVELNERLHDLREYLTRTKAGLVETNTYIPVVLAADFKQFAINTDRASHQISPMIMLRACADDADKLQVFVMETFQLLMSSISVRDSQTSIEQARRGTLITWLAFVYVPLSFVTGIFGMDLKELNDSTVSIWVFFVSLVVVVLTTLLLFVAYRINEMRKRAAKGLTVSSWYRYLLGPFETLAATWRRVQAHRISYFDRQQRQLPQRTRPGDSQL